MSEFPIGVVVKENEHQWVIRCPYCRKRHYHGIGEGHRVAHCLFKAVRDAHCLEKDENNIGYIVRMPTSEGVQAWMLQHETLFSFRERKELELQWRKLLQLRQVGGG
jgi:hypothetical protein